jgi:sugar phosphate permease
MVLLGIAQGASLGPLTSAGMVRVSADDAGSASGLVNVAHQIGGSLGLGILVTVFAGARSNTITGSTLPAHQVSAALTAGTGLLALALIWCCC